MESMIRQGIALGLDQMCFTEHMDFEFPVTEAVPKGFFELNTDSYLFDLIKYREKYRQQIKILFGVELGLQAHLIEPQIDFCGSKPFDFIIGSSHLAHTLDPYNANYWEGRTEEQAYRDYFVAVLENLEDTVDIDTYGHLDYIVRYGKTKDTEFTYQKYADELEQILDLLVQKGIGLEINTAGIRYGLKDLHPCREILTRYREKGGHIITVGSDAHKPEDLCRGFDRAEEFLKECGFRYYAVFEKRNPEFYKL